MFVTKLEVNNFLGITSSVIEPGKINIFKGPKGGGKSSVLEALDKLLKNTSYRTELVKHGADEATLYLKLSDGLSVERRVRDNKKDLLKIRKENMGVPQTEKFLRGLISGEIFRPIKWVYYDKKEQTKSLLSMIRIEWNMDNLHSWFGEVPEGIDYENTHILTILKKVEEGYYRDREEINREIKELRGRVEGIYEDLPPNYSGEDWRSKDIEAYYKKLSDAQEENRLIGEAREKSKGFLEKINSIKASGESEVLRVTLRYKNEEEDIKDIISLTELKINKAKDFISAKEEKINVEISKLENAYEEENRRLILKYSKLKEEKREEIEKGVVEQKELIASSLSKISKKQGELGTLEEKQRGEVHLINEKVRSQIEKEEILMGRASEYLENHKEIDLEPLKDEANKVTKMVSYLRDWDRIIDIRDGDLASKERVSAKLTKKIEMARNLPTELLRVAKMPIEGVSLDKEGNFRINGKLIDGLSDGEKLELAMKVAKAQCGDLKVICIDKFESLDKKSQDVLIQEMKKDGFQYFVTKVSDTDSGGVEIEKIGELEIEKLRGKKDE